ncbi:hypothetical protein ACMFMG_008830 [Clarireedia jacksonii]
MLTSRPSTIQFPCLAYHAQALSTAGASSISSLYNTYVSLTRCLHYSLKFPLFQFSSLVHHRKGKERERKREVIPGPSQFFPIQSQPRRASKVPINIRGRSTLVWMERQSL